MQWTKLHASLAQRPEFRLASDEAIGAWTRLMWFTASTDTRGVVSLSRYDDRQLEILLGTTRKAIEKAIESGLVLRDGERLKIVGFDGSDVGGRPRNSSGIRKSKTRNENQVSKPGSKTSRENLARIEEKRGEEKRGEETPQSPPDAAVAAAPSARQVIAVWCEVWREERKSSYVVTGKDSGQASAFSFAGEAEALREPMRRYLRDRSDDFLLKTGHPLWAFFGKVNKYTGSSPAQGSQQQRPLGFPTTSTERLT